MLFCARVSLRSRASRTVVGLALLAITAGAACKRRDQRAANSPRESAALNISNQSVSTALQELSRLSGLAIVVAPSATEVAACVRISVLAPQPVPPAQLQRLVAIALESTPLEVQQRSEGWLVQRRVGAALPDSCAGLGYRENALANVARRQREREALEANGATATEANADGGGSPRSFPPDDELTASVISGISPIDEHTFTVTRSSRDAIFSNTEALLRQVRIMPRYEEGAVRGLRLYGIRRSSVVGALGLQNGDTVLSINGLPMTDPERTLEAFNRMRRAESVSVVIERRRQQQTLSYRLADPSTGPAAPRR